MIFLCTFYVLRCLNEYSFICRSATYNTVERSCALSRFTRRSYPDYLEDDPNSDYLENTCLTGENPFWLLKYRHFLFFSNNI